MTPSSMLALFIMAMTSLVQTHTAPLVDRQDPEAPWRATGHPGAVTFDTSGVLGSPAGVALSVQSSTDLAPVTVSKSLPADALRLQVIRLSGRLKTQNVTRFASIWVQVDGRSGVLVRDRGRNRTMTGNADWKTFDVAISVPRSATRIEFGVVLSGTGTADVEGLTMSPVRSIDTTAAIGQKPAKLLDAAIDIVRKHSLWRDTLSWNVLLPEVRELAAGAKSEADAYPAIDFLITRLGDRHSSFNPPGRPSPNLTANTIPSVQTVENDVGAVRMAGYLRTNSDEIRRYVTTVYERLATAKPAASCGWIVDLRENNGGNYGPMMVSLRPFLGDQTLGFFVSRTVAEEWSAKRVSESYGLPRPPRALDDLATQPVAVLTGPRTGSSGEVITIAFRGRPRTRSFGLPTAGVSTGNAGFPLPGGGSLTLTTVMDADRNSVRYGNVVRPDSLFSYSAAEVSGGVDPVQAAAVAWLRSESKCR